MSKILGLDLGTNSIGWAVVDNRNNSFNIIEYKDLPTKGVVIFPEGVKKEKGNEKSRAAERTDFRGARRLKFRRKLRKYYTLKALIENEMCPLSKETLLEWGNSINEETSKKERFKKYPDEEAFLNWLKTDSYGEKGNTDHKNIRKQQKENPYYYRDKYSRKKYNWEENQKLAYELGRAFYHLAQRRGFKSNRLEQSDENIIMDIKDQIQVALDDCNNSAMLLKKINDIFDYDFDNKTKDDLDATEQKLKRIKNYIIKVLANKIKNQDYTKYDDAKKEIDRYINKPENLGPVLGGIKELTEKIQQAPNCQTLGQYFWHLYQNDRNNPDFKIRNNYTHREEHYEEEFNIICEKQQIPENLKLNLWKAIFFQRPLKSQKGLVGKCTFEKNKPRCPISRPEFEEYRMWAFINNIKIKTPADEQMRVLSKEEKDSIIPKFYRQKSNFKFEDIAKSINSSNDFVYYKDREAKNADYLINYKLNTTVSGCPISAAFKNIFGENWKTEIYKNNKNGEPIYLCDIAWHVIFRYDDKDKLIEFATNKLGLDKTKSKKFSKIVPKQGYANLSLKAINKILPWLEKGLIYSHAVFMANLEKVIDIDKWKNQETRNVIEEEIKHIIENHTDETRKYLAINSIIKNLRDDEDIDTDYLNVSDFKDDLLDKLKSIFGEKSWKEKSNNQDYFNDTYNILKSQLAKINTKQSFAKVKRIDERVIEFLTDNDFFTDSDRLKYLYHPSDIENFKPVIAKDKEGNPIIVNDKELEILPLPKTDAIKNPVLIRAMHQLRKLINELLKQGVIDDKTKIHIELAREVNDANQRAAWKTWQDKLRDKRENAINEIKELYKAESNKDVDPNEDDLTRFLLWKEQKKKKIYEDDDEAFISICDIIGPDPKFDYEHTIPRSLSWDNSMMNKTLCSKKFNRFVKQNQIPSQLSNHKDILQRIEHWKEKIDKLDKDIKKINASNITDPETKSRTIQKRHLLKFKYEYWKGKYDRFTMEEVPDGFKNSQISDTGLITRFARKYLSCLFRTASGNSNVFVVNGLAVDQFRKAWGIQEEKMKSRTNHIHHCIDAVTIACMTKDKYDAFAEEWRKQEDDYIKHGSVQRLKIEKPWKTFTEDVKNLENEVLIVHNHKDNFQKQTKKKLRKRGKIQYNDYDKTKPIILKGDTVRDSLHKDTFFGAIKKNDAIKYVVRKKLEKLNSVDVKNIVDENIKKIIEEAVKAKIITFNKRGAKINGTVWQNESKNIPIKKVRIYTPTVKKPLEDFKKHSTPFLSEKEYKQQFNVVNDGNYCLAIYEGKNNKNKTVRESILLNNIQAGDYFRIGSKKKRVEDHYDIVPEYYPETKYPIKYLLKKSQNVILLNNPDEDVFWNNQDWLKNRLYIITGIDEDGIKMYYHQEARATTDVIKFMNNIIDNNKFEELIPEFSLIDNVNLEELFQQLNDPENNKKDFFDKINKLLNDYYSNNNITDPKGNIKKFKLSESKLTSPKGGDVVDKYYDFPYIKFKPNGFHGLIENVHFKFDIIGRIIKHD
jgi:CRISPR-associated endonuclease Csn1